MSYLRAHTPLRRSAQHWVNDPLMRLFPQGPLFTHVTPICNPELGAFIRDTFPRAELRKDNHCFIWRLKYLIIVNKTFLSLSSMTMLSISLEHTDGTCRVSNEAESEINDAKQTIKSPPTEDKYESYVINPSDAEKDYQIIGTERV